MKFGLTKEQLIARRAGLGGSDAPKIMAGGEAWWSLWADKTGRAEPKAVMSEWDSALRHCTETLQMDWMEYKTGRKIERRGEVAIHPDMPIMRCTLDGFDAERNAVIQAKHVSQFTPNPIQWCVDHYFAQVQHEVFVTGADCGDLTIIVGMSEPVVKTFQIDPFHRDAYLERCKEFWSFVESDEPPPGAPEMGLPPIPHEDMREVDMTGSNEWADFAATWLETKDHAKRFESASKSLKAMVEGDVKMASGHGIKISRSKAGALTIKDEK